MKTWIIRSVVHVAMIAVMISSLEGADEDRLNPIIGLYGVDYRDRIDGLAADLASGQITFSFPFQDGEKEVAARAAIVRYAHPYIEAWLKMNFENFIHDLTESEAQKRAWKAADQESPFGGITIDPSFCDAFAFYALSADRQVNAKWMGVPLPRSVDPKSHVGHGSRHDATYIALLESVVFQPFDLALLNQAASNHCRAAWLRLASAYLIDYCGPSDDRLRVIAAETLHRRIIDPKAPSIVRAVWLETYAGLVVDMTAGVATAETFLVSDDTGMVVAAARAMLILARSSDNPEFRLRLSRRLQEVSLTATQSVAACLEKLSALAAIHEPRPE